MDSGCLKSRERLRTSTHVGEVRYVSGAGARYELALARFELFRVPDRAFADADRAAAMEGFSDLGISDPSVLVPRVPYDRRSVEQPADASSMS